jgi:sec-independent protein translocase protein TatA
MLQSILLGILGGQEVLIIAILILLMFGGKKIPELMRGLGKGMKEFKDAKEGVDDKKEEEKK